LVSNCNSFALHDRFVVFTTHEHSLWFINTDTTLDVAFDRFLKRSDQSQVAMVRIVERGSRIVTVVPHGVRVVLQMPRGNLETVFPRPLLLVALSTFLQEKQYRRAFFISRKHRLNLNLLFDFDRDTFNAHITEFVSALDKVSSINLFLSDLSDLDHSDEFRTCGVEPKPKLSINGKKDTMCNYIRDVLMKNEKKYMLSIVHSYLCKSIPEYDAMLEYIRTVRTRDGTDVADSALKYAGVVVKDSDLLYQAALGTYDFDLVVMVAQVLQKDPKEYLPFLEDLASNTEQVKRYKIDLHLKRYSKALANLAVATADHFPTCMELVTTHGLYIDALKLYKVGENKEFYKQIQDAAATNLLKLKKYRESGLMFQACGEVQKAIDAFVQGNEWKWALSAITKVEMEDAAKHELTLGIARKLQGSSRYIEAAYVAEHYLDDPELSIEFQIQAKSWEEALAALHRHKRLDLIETHLKEAIVIHADQFIQGFTGEEGLFHTFNTHTNRLLIVRKQKYAHKLEMLNDDWDDNPESDLYSDTSSRTSNRSRSSRSGSRSSKSSKSSKKSNVTHRTKRRNEAKKTSLREGGTYEELALLHILNEIVVTIEKSKPTALPLCSVLYHLGFGAKGLKVEETLTKMQTLVWERYDEIWSIKALLSSTVGDGDDGPSLTFAAPVSGPDTTTNARIAQMALDAEENAVKHPLEGLVSTLKSVKIDEVDVDVPPPPPQKLSDKEESKTWESLYLQHI